MSIQLKKKLPAHLNTIPELPELIDRFLVLETQNDGDIPRIVEILIAENIWLRKSASVGHTRKMEPDFEALPHFLKLNIK